jgi:pimeloyl-ACP methyl ester carboxylesterase
VASDRPLTIVCLHGLGPKGPAVFDAAADAWRRDFDVRVLPFPGFAGEPPVSRAECLPSALARRVESSIEVERFAVVGFSWGGNVGVRIAPARLRALVLVDIGYQSQTEEPETYEQLLARYADVDFVAPEVAAAGFAGVAAEPAAGVLPRLHDVPVLLLVATEPHVERREDDLARFRELVPHAEVRVFPGASHDVLNTAPESVAAVADWLAAAD